MLKGKTYGFTLLELMIVVAIIGVLAALAIPKYRDMIEKSREGATKGNIGAIMSSLAIYYSDNKGAWPEDISANTYAKYLDRIPAVKVTHPDGGTQLSGNSNAVDIPNSGNNGNGNAYGKYKFKANTDGWRYDPGGGGVWVNNSQTDSAGVDYTLYGYQ